MGGGYTAILTTITPPPGHTINQSPSTPGKTITPPHPEYQNNNKTNTQMKRKFSDFTEFTTHTGKERLSKHKLLWLYTSRAKNS